MEKRLLRQLYRLLSRAEQEHDAKAVSALQWAIMMLQARLY